MEKEFVTYKLALRLKALGFNGPCFGYYAGDILCTGQPQEIHLDEDGNYKKSKTESFPITVAPTFSQAFRWFREKHNLDSFVKHLYKSTIKVGYYFGIDEYKGVEFQMDFDAWYKTPEEAELACLEKLIEIVESKTK